MTILLRRNLSMFYLDTHSLLIYLTIISYCFSLGLLESESFIMMFVVYVEKECRGGVDLKLSWREG